VTGRDRALTTGSQQRGSSHLRSVSVQMPGSLKAALVPDTGVREQSMWPSAAANEGRPVESAAKLSSAAPERS